MNNVTKLFGLFFLFALTLTACKKEDEAKLIKEFKPKFKDKEVLKISAELKSNTDSEAVVAYQSASQVKQYVEAYSELFNIPEEATRVAQKTAAANASVWTWSYGQYTVFLTLTETPTKYEFDYDYQLNGSSFYSIEGWEYKNQTAGHYEASYIGYNDLVMDWNTTANGYHITMDYSVGGQNAINYEANYNNDGSGDFSRKIYGASHPDYTAVWDANGHGTANYYNHSTGVLISTHTF